MKASELYIGLDVHKDSKRQSHRGARPKGEIRVFGTVSIDIDRLEKMLRRIAKAHPNAQLNVTYEAGLWICNPPPPQTMSSGRVLK